MFFGHFVQFRKDSLLSASINLQLLGLGMVSYRLIRISTIFFFQKVLQTRILVTLFKIHLTKGYFNANCFLTQLTYPNCYAGKFRSRFNRKARAT